MCWSRAFSSWPVRWTQWTCRHWTKLLWGAFGCCRYIDHLCRTTFLWRNCLAPVQVWTILHMIYFSSFLSSVFLPDRIASQICVGSEWPNRRLSTLLLRNVFVILKLVFLFSFFTYMWDSKRVGNFWSLVLGAEFHNLCDSLYVQNCLFFTVLVGKSPEHPRNPQDTFQLLLN